MVSHETTPHNPDHTVTTLSVKTVCIPVDVRCSPHGKQIKDDTDTKQTVGNSDEMKTGGHCILSAGHWFSGYYYIYALSF